MASLAAARTALDHPLAWRLLGLAAFNVTDNSHWRPRHYVIWVVLIAAAMELLQRLVLAWGHNVAGYNAPERRIKPGGKPLSQLAFVDVLFISISKLLTAVFTYHAIRYAWTQETIVWGPLTLANSALALPALYITYDLFYTFFHRALHIPAIYPYIHKHHHRQIVPTRGNLDAINVHPFEFVCGEYNHLLAVHLVGTGLKYAAAAAAATSGALPLRLAAVLGLATPALAGVHVGAMAVFFVLGGVLASLNHTRFDITWGGGLFCVAYHDVHHTLYRFNYGQYIMLWDVIGRSFRAPVEGRTEAQSKQLQLKKAA